MIPLIVLFVLYLPKYVGDDLHRNRFTEWLMHGEEPFSGKITIWHVVEFRPYLGSVGSFLKDAARTVEKQHFGVYLNVESITLEEAKARLSNAEFPDVLSFPAGFVDESMLMAFDTDLVERFGRLTDLALGEINSNVYAVPYAASCRLLMYDSARLDPDNFVDIDAAEQNKPEDFKAGKADCCIGDARAVGDMMRSALSGKIKSFEVMTFEDGTALVQFLGIGISCDELKLPYIYEFVSKIFSEQNQKKLCELGLMPLGNDAELKYEQDFLGQAYLRISENLDHISNFRGE